MSEAAITVQQALLAALRAAPEVANAVSGIYDGPPPDAACPYVEITDGATADWSCKTARGREHRMSIAIWGDGSDPGRLHRLMADAEEAIEAMPRDLPGRRIASLVFLRARLVRDADGPWAGRLDYRVRTMEV